MGRQLKISISDQEDSLLQEMSEFWTRSLADLAQDSFRRGLPGVTADYLAVRRIDRPLTAETPLEYKSLEQALMMNWDNLLKRCRVPADRLIEIKGGDRPTELEIARMAIALNLTEEYLENLPSKNGDKSNAKVS